MIPIPSAARVWLVTGHTDMRKGFDGLALIVQETLRRDPHSGHLFVFRGRRGSLIKWVCLTFRAESASGEATSGRVGVRRLRDRTSRA